MQVRTPIPSPALFPASLICRDLSPPWRCLLSSRAWCRSTAGCRPWRREPSSTRCRSPSQGRCTRCCISGACISPGKRWRFPGRSRDVIKRYLGKDCRCNKDLAECLGQARLLEEGEQREALHSEKKNPTSNISFLYSLNNTSQRLLQKGATFQV